MPDILWTTFVLACGLILGFAAGQWWERNRPPEKTDDGPLN